jgi:hypothetical protein
MNLKETFLELKVIVTGIMKDEYYSTTTMKELESKLTELHENVDEAYAEVEHWEDKFRDLEDEVDSDWMHDDYDNLQKQYTCDLIDELSRRRVSEDNVIVSTNPRDEMKVEILQDIFNKYNLEQLQELNERFITGK